MGGAPCCRIAFKRALAALDSLCPTFQTAPALSGKGVFVRIALLIVLLTLISALIPGCGYHSIAQDGQAHFGEGATVSIPIFSNKTYKPNLENVLLNDLISEFAKRNGLRVVERDESDYTLSGEVLTYGKLAISYTGYDIVKEYKATMTISATLRKNSNQKVVWKGQLSWSEDFPASSDIAIQQNSEDAAIQVICRRLAQQLYLRINEDF